MLQILRRRETGMNPKKKGFPIIPLMAAAIAALIIAVIALAALLTREKGELLKAKETISEMEVELTKAEERIGELELSARRPEIKTEEIPETEIETETEAETETKTEAETETETEKDTEETEKTVEEIGAGTTIIGDSITWLTEDQLKAALPGVDIYSQGGKQFTYDNAENPGGLQIIKSLADSGALRDTVVFALGSNNRDAVGTPPVDAAMMETLHGITGDRRVFLVTNYDLLNPGTYDRNNAAIRAAAEKYGWSVIDWAGIVSGTGNPGAYILNEGEAAVGNMQVHPTDPAGKKLWVDSITAALTGKQ